MIEPSCWKRNSDAGPMAPGARAGEQRIDRSRVRLVRSARQHLAAGITRRLDEVATRIVRVAPAVDEEIAVALEDAFALGPVEADHDVAAAVGGIHAHERADAGFLAVAVAP